jgi:hypothetical protein
MKRIRFTIGGLLTVIFCVAVATAALRASTDLWENAVFSTTLFVLATSTLLAVHRTGGKRAFWLGFVVFGGVYLSASVMPSIDSRLLTTQGLTYLDSKIPDRSREVLVLTGSAITSSTASTAQAMGGSTAVRWNVSTTPYPGSAVRLWTTTGRLLGGSSGTTENFLRIGHCVLALLFAFIGGRFSRLLHQPTAEESPASSEHPTSMATHAAEQSEAGEAP